MSKPKRRATKVRVFSWRFRGETSVLGPNGEENVYQKHTISAAIPNSGGTAIPNSGGAGGRRPTGNGGLEGEAPQWKEILSYFIHRSEGLPERDISSLCVMGGGLEAAGNSSAAAVAVAAPPPINVFFAIGSQNRDLGAKPPQNCS